MIKWKKRNPSGKRCIFINCRICHKRHYAKGLCKVHYNNLMSGRLLQSPVCRVPDCGVKCRTNAKERLCSCHKEYSLRKRRPTFKPIQGHYKDNRVYYKFKKNACEICHSTRFLLMHHRDGNTLNPATENLQTLCVSCHCKLHHR